jgi:HSP20 family protein
MATENRNQGASRDNQTDTNQQTGQSTALARRQSSLPSFFDAPLTGSPFGMMRRMMDDMDRLFEDFGFGRPLFSRGGGMQQRESGMEGPLWSPQVEVLEGDGNLLVRADLPGMKQEDIDVELRDDDTLVVRGERKQESEHERGGTWRSERSYGSFCRVIQLPEGIDAENASASFENGVLEIAFKLPERQNRTRKIEVKGGKRTEEGKTTEVSEQQPSVH